MTAALAVVCGLLGVVVGAACVCLIRTAPTGEPLLPLRRRCRSCQMSDERSALVPSSLAFAARTRRARCGHPPSGRDIAVEVGCGVLFAAVAARLGPAPELPAYLVLVAGLLILSVVDLEHFLLPNRILYPTLLAVAALLGLASVAHRDSASLLRAAIGGAAAFAAFFVMNLVYEKGMAFGDVRLSGVLGVALGWLGLRDVVAGFLIAFVASVVLGVGLVVVRRRGFHDPIPFGPFLALGTLIVLIGGPDLVVALFPS